MTVTIAIKVEDVETMLETFTVIQLVRSATADGAYGLIATETLVSGDYYYVITDSTGSPSFFYKYRFYNPTGPVASDYTNPFQPSQVSRQKLRQHVIETYDLGMVLVAANGNLLTTTFKTDDYRVKSTFHSSGYGTGGYLLAFSAFGVPVTEARRIVDTDFSNGLFTVSPAFSQTMQSDDQVEWNWSGIDPIQFNNLINKGLSRYQYLDRIPIVGDGNAEQSLSYVPWLVSRGQITGLWHFPGGGLTEEPFMWWNARQESGYITLMTSPTLSTADTVYLEAIRSLPPLFTDDSVLPQQANIDLAAALVYDEVLAYLLRPGSSAADQDKTSWAIAKQQHLNTLKKLYRRYGPHPRMNRPTNAQPALVNTPWTAR
jgi:hypothetical protein